VASVSVQVMPGSVFALLGPNGSGKSSLFSVLSGDVRPDSGNATILGRDCFEDRDYIRQRVSFVEQFDVPIELLTIDEFLWLVCRFVLCHYRYAVLC
jgi:ABC-type multidrug transport system ATPase subunit